MTAHCRITPVEAQEPTHETGRRGDAFRGRYLDRCAIVEQWAHSILKAADGKPRSAHLFGQKLKAVRELACAQSSPFKAPERVLHLLDSFQPFAELRARLAHAIQTVAHTEEGIDLTIFTPVHGAGGDRLSDVLTNADMARLNGELARLAKELTDQRLKSVTPSSPLQPKPA